MSYERAENFVEDTEADATTVESEFDNIADWLTDLFQTDRIAASADLELPKAITDIPGASTTIVAPRASKLLVWTTFDFEVLSDDGSAIGYLYVDSVGQSPAAVLTGDTVGTRQIVPQNYCMSVAPGSHEVKLRGNSPAVAKSCKSYQVHTAFTYLLIPEP